MHEQVPTPDRILLATPYGLLFNELVRSPETVLKPCLGLLRQALALDSGDVRESTLSLILFVVRLCTRVDNYIACVVRHVETDVSDSSTTSTGPLA